MSSRSSQTPSLRAHSSSINSTTSTIRPTPSRLKVITAPPWAKDEPPSPREEIRTGSSDAFNTLPSSSTRNLPDALSVSSSGAPDSGWWTFVRDRSRQKEPDIENYPKTPENKGKRPSTAEKMKATATPILERSRTWLASRTNTMDQQASPVKGRSSPNEDNVEEGAASSSKRKPWDFQIPLPSPPKLTFTRAQNDTPGWNVPWSHQPFNTHEGQNDHRDPSWLNSSSEKQSSKTGKRTQARRQKFGKFIVTNVYVPLIVRILNLLLTSATLAVAVRIRRIERQHGVLGAVGSSTILSLIFAPLALVHVMSAIYLEYFGRPLGLWRTSGKLAHTLSEMFFICMWSSLLSLAFDNYFTSVLGCAAPSARSWYSQLPPPPNPLPDEFGRRQADQICDSQVALTCLVGVGLVMYCSNLVISLFRIFEKVKYLGGSGSMRRP